MLVGELLSNRYQIVRLLGEGGMGAVYEALHVRLDKRVVVKTLREDLSRDPKFRQRFLQEARATSSIAHENIVTVHDVDVHDERIVYFVMEYLAGEDLEATLEREQRLPWPRVRKIGLQLCAALAAAHAKKIIHRDLKPSNCFRTSSGDNVEFIKILDFGIAKILESASGDIAADRNRRRQLTETGQIFGTMAYMSPEHCRGDPVDHRTDIYATGVILFELLTGRTPFLADNPVRFIQSLEFEPAPPPSRHAPSAGIPADLDYAIMRALEKRPEDRFVDMHEFLDALRDIHQDLVPAPQPPALEVLRPRHVDTDALTRVHFPPLPSAPAPSVAPPAPRRRSVWLGGTLVTVGLVASWLWISSLRHAGSIPDVQPPAPSPDRSPPSPEPSPPVSPPPPAPRSIEPKPAPSAPILAPPSVPQTDTTTLDAPPSEADTDREAARTTAATAPDRPSTAPRQELELAPCALTPMDRHLMLQGHYEALDQQCKQGIPPGVRFGVMLQIVAGRVKAWPMEGQTGKRLDGARCVSNYVRRKVKALPPFKGCKSPPVTYWY